MFQFLIEYTFLKILVMKSGNGKRRFYLHSDLEYWWRWALTDLERPLKLFTLTWSRPYDMETTRFYFLLKNYVMQLEAVVESQFRGRLRHEQIPSYSCVRIGFNYQLGKIICCLWRWRKQRGSEGSCEWLRAGISFEVIISNETRFRNSMPLFFDVNRRKAKLKFSA